MSATHIATVAGGLYCGRGRDGRDGVRGFITAAEYKQMEGAGVLRKRTRTSVKHSCKKQPCQCPRRKEEINGICAECRSRVGRGE